MSDITPALDALGIDYTVHGDEASACCPSPGHPDSHPSWSVNLRTGMHHCFACGFGGGFPSLVKVLNGGSAQAARVWVTQQAIRSGPVHSPAPRSAPVDSSWRYGEAALDSMAPVPSERLAQRMLTPEAAQLYQVRWDSSSRAWVLPIRDRDGTLLGWQEKDGRFFRNRPRTVPKSSSVFGLWTVRRGQCVILVESPLDAVRFRSAGIEGAVSSFGASVSAAQCALIANCASALLLALDNDEAGRRETRRLIARHPRVMLFNYGDSPAKDPGDGMTDDELRWGVQNALVPVAWLARQSARAHAG